MVPHKRDYKRSYRQSMVRLGFGWIGVGWVVLVCVGWMKLCNYCPKLVRIASKYLISKKRDTIYCLEFVSINLIVCFRRRYRERELAALD